MTIFQQGPYAGAMLADLGADVVKIEGPDSPDPGRFGAQWMTPLGNAYFHSLNRGKRAICVDLKDPRGKAVVHKLVESADVFISNMRPPALRNLGMDYETLGRINPRLIYAHASAYGPKGPDAEVGGMDILGQARGGIMSVTGDPDTPPQSAGSGTADHVGALTLAFGIVAGLLYREREGVGQEIDASLLGGQLCIQTHLVTTSLWNNELPVRQHHGPNPTWNTYLGSDGKWFCLGMSRDSYWPGVCRVLGKPEWLTDPRYSTLVARQQRSDEMFDAFQEIFRTKPAAEWVRLMTAEDLLAAPVQDYFDLPDDPQVVANDYLVSVERSDGSGPVLMVNTPVIFGKTPGSIRKLGPEFGQHTEEVLLEVGYSWEELAVLSADGVIGPRSS